MTAFHVKRRHAITCKLLLLLEARLPPQAVKRDLHGEVSLSKHRVLNDPESDILVRERLVASFCFARVASIVIVIGVIWALPGIESVVGVVWVVPEIEATEVEVG